MQLREYQQRGVAGINDAWAAAQNVIYVLPCRGGKTPIAAHKILHNTGHSVAIAHRGFLVTQMSKTLARNGVRHAVMSSKATRQECSRQHLLEFGKNYVDVNAKCTVATVQTLAMMYDNDPLFKNATLWFTDEGHHIVADNLWGRVIARMHNARGLAVSATPTRADGKGLGRHADGVLDAMVIGPTMRDLIRDGYVADYRIFAPPSDLDLSGVGMAASGDFSPDPLRKAVHKSHIVGDIVQHYLRIAPGKVGMTFAVDIESATEIAAAFRASGVPAECVSSKTEQRVRFDIERRHQRGEVLQLVNVDLYGEGADIQKLEVVSFGRPTASYGTYVQQFCRPLNADASKPYGIIIDHVGNVHRHGLPDAPRTWTLDRREKRGKSKPTDTIAVRTCPKCLGVYERAAHGLTCPYCQAVATPPSRSSIEAIDGDLYELDADTLARMRGEVDAAVKHHPDRVVQMTLDKRHREKQAAQELLRAEMARWAGARSDATDEATVRRLQREFYVQWGIDTLSAQALGKTEALELLERMTGEKVRVEPVRQMRVCQNPACGKEFPSPPPSDIALGRGRYCSAECYHVTLVKKETCVCQNPACGKEFPSPPPSAIAQGRGKYCSAKCGDTDRARTRANAKCPTCGKYFYKNPSRRLANCPECRAAKKAKL